MTNALAYSTVAAHMEMAGIENALAYCAIFALDKQFHPSLIFAGQARSLNTEWSLIRSFS